jgi:hypothetical protein
LVAYDSAATNLVAGDTNGRRDVFVLYKSRVAAELGGRLVRASVGARGVQGNGDSSHPSLDGTTGEMPHCVAFDSTATNLAPGARGNARSIYVRDLKAHRTLLASRGSRSASDAAIDGRCGSVSYSAGGWVLLRDLHSNQVLRVARGADPDQQTDGKGVAYESHGQVYLQRVVRHRNGLALSGRAILISDTRQRRPGNGVSSNPTVDDHGAHVAFESTATDLCTNRCPGFKTSGQIDQNGPVSDVFIRTLVQSAHGRYEPAVQLVSGGVSFQGNGDSRNPAISRAGQTVVFDTSSTSLVHSYLGTGRNILRWYWSGVRGYAAVDLVSSAPPWRLPDSILNGPSFRPSISSRGNYVGFTSFESGQDGEQNGPGLPDVFVRFMGLNHEGLPTH